MSERPILRKMGDRTCLYIKRDEFYAGDTRLIVEDWIDICSLMDSVRILSIAGTFAYYSYVPLFTSRHRLLSYTYCEDTLKSRDHDFYRRALVLGCGGGAIPRWLLQEYPDVLVDVVDYSPEIIEACRKYFLTKWDNSDHLRYYCTDAEDYESLGYTYEFIFCDLFDGMNLAPLVYNRSFAGKLRGMLSDDGILVINCGWGDVKKLREVYAEAFEFTKVPDRNRLQTAVIMAGTAPF